MHKKILKECTKSSEVHFEVVRPVRPTNHQLQSGGAHGLTVDKGGVVTAVASGSPAEQANFVPGQRILTVQGESVFPKTKKIPTYLKSGAMLNVWSIQPVSLGEEVSNLSESIDLSSPTTPRSYYFQEEDEEEQEGDEGDELGPDDIALINEAKKRAEQKRRESLMGWATTEDEEKEMRDRPVVPVKKKGSKSARHAKKVARLIALGSIKEGDEISDDEGDDLEEEEGVEATTEADTFAEAEQKTRGRQSVVMSFAVPDSEDEDDQEQQEIQQPTHTQEQQEEAQDIIDRSEGGLASQENDVDANAPITWTLAERVDDSVTRRNSQSENTPVHPTIPRELMSPLNLPPLELIPHAPMNGVPESRRNGATAFTTEHIANYGDLPCLIDPEARVRMTYSEFGVKLKTVAKRLRDHGLRRGDVLLLACSYHIYNPLVLHAALLVGAVVSCCDPASQMLAHHLSESRASFVCTTARYLDEIKLALDNRTLVHTIVVLDPPHISRIYCKQLRAVLPFEGLLHPDVEEEVPYAESLDAVRFLDPKSVRLTHTEMLANLRLCATELPLHQGDVVLVCLPFFQLCGLSLVSVALRQGCTVLFPPADATPAYILAMVKTHTVSYVVAEPPLAESLTSEITNPPSAEPYDLSTLKAICGVVDRRDDEDQSLDL